MKIVSVNNTADIYGASRCMERVFRRFVQDGHEVHAVLPEEGPLSRLLRAEGFVVHIHRGMAVIDRSRLRDLRGLLRFAVQFPLSVFWFAQLFLRFDVDVVHTNTVVMPSPAFAAFLTHRRHIWHVRELLGEFGVIWKPYQRFMSMFSDTVIAVSQCTRDQFAPSLRGKVEVVYDGLDETAGVVLAEQCKRVRAEFPEGSTLIGVVGRIKFHRKGQEVLVKAAGRLRAEFPEAHYAVIGSTSPGNEDHGVRLKQLIDSLGMSDRISLIGELEHPASIFAGLDIAVVPSVQLEPFGCVVIEAMAVGTPVVGSRGGGIAEQIVDGESGLLFEPGNDEALADALGQLLRNPSLRQRLSENGRDRVRLSFSLENTYRCMRRILLQTPARPVE